MKYVMFLLFALVGNLASINASALTVDSSDQKSTFSNQQFIVGDYDRKIVHLIAILTLEELNHSNMENQLESTVLGSFHDSMNDQLVPTECFGTAETRTLYGSWD